jgi:hypothetical protein
MLETLLVLKICLVLTQKNMLKVEFISILKHWFMEVSWIYSSLINEVDMFMQEKIKLVIELYECF